MAQETLKTINSHRKELGFEGVVVFNALMARLDFENFIQVSQSEIAIELDMKPSNVSRAVKKLCDLGFIRRGPKVGRSTTFQLHPELCWKGKPKKHQRATEQARQQGWTIIDGGQTRDPDEPELPF
jgi:DNA-binding IclR family transcriptional regulator